jgi:two-component system response regulator PilR (NtrC family)
MTKQSILVVDDELSMREFLELMLTREGYQVTLASGGREALDLVDGRTFDLVITDIRMNEVDGIEVLKGVRSKSPQTVVILISAFATVETAVTAMREGAYDFIPKPFKIEDLKTVLQSALDHRTPEAERRVLEARVREGCHFGSLVGVSPAMQKVYDLVRRAAQTNTNILISGESGTGKELVARAIHENSPRASERFVAINCGGVPEQLIESELFGHRKGAFTGANTDTPGLFELANKGTIFLDELGELTIPVQVKLLRVIQEKTFRAVGGRREHTLDVRFIAATNKNLEAEVMASRFREDLYYRINVINIHMPPLRNRREDIPLLAQYFLEKYSQTMGKDVRKISAFALDILSDYHFPGNVRELENIIERSVALEQTSIVLPESLSLASFKQERRMGEPPKEQLEWPIPETAIPVPKDTGSLGLDEVLASLERRYLILALKTADGVKQRAADLLEISAWRLRGRLKDYRLNRISRAEMDQLIDRMDDIAGLPDDLVPEWNDQGIALDTILLRAERYLLDNAMAKAEGSKTKAAALLGISRRTLLHRLDRTKGVGRR